MLEKRLSRQVFALLGSILLSGGLAHADVLYDNTITLLSTDPTQLGRLSRNGTAADWSGPKTFPGVLNPTISYHYEAIAVTVPQGESFLQISIDSNNGNIFASVYDTSYDPDPLALNRGLDVNYMGDAGGSGNFFDTSPRFFQVVDLTAATSSSGGTVIVVLTETTTTGAGLNSPVGLLVEGFADTCFDDTIADPTCQAPSPGGGSTGGDGGSTDVPEPSTVTLLGAPLLALAVAYRRRALAA
jgi:hypothetical protein